MRCAHLSTGPHQLYHIKNHTSTQEVLPAEVMNKTFFGQVGPLINRIEI